MGVQLEISEVFWQNVRQICM